MGAGLGQGARREGNLLRFVVQLLCFKKPVESVL